MPWWPLTTGDKPFHDNKYFHDYNYVILCCNWMANLSSEALQFLGTIIIFCCVVKAQENPLY